MQLHQETGSKQHILAEDTLGNHLVPSLSNLYISTFPDCTVLAVFSSLEKKLLAYKITNPIDNLIKVEQWMHEDFNHKTTVSFTHDYEVTPQLFSNNVFNEQNTVGDLIISYKTEAQEETIHYLTAIIKFHLIKKLNNQIYLYNRSKFYTLLLMNKEGCILANTFQCENENEVLYFLLNSLQVSDILPSDTTLNIDYSLSDHTELVQFLSPHVAKTEKLNFTFDGINPAIPKLSEKLFACYAASLCV